MSFPDKAGPRPPAGYNVAKTAAAFAGVAA